MDTIDLSGLNLSEKEQKILDAAIKVFSKKGFSAATTSEIAKSAGIAEGTIFRYFKTKKDILRSILICMISLMSGKLVIEPVEKILQNSDGKDLHAVLKELMYDRLKLADTMYPMFRVVLTEALFHDDVREALYQNIISRALVAFSEFHKHMAQKGMLRDTVEPEVFTRSIIGCMFILIAQRKFLGDKIAINDLDKELDKTIDIMLYGISK